MMDWFNGKQKRTKQRLENRIAELEKQLALLQQDRASEPIGGKIDIHIDHLSLYRPVLENLIFNLDKLDIKELSGSLNLGNNFGVKTAADIVKKVSSQNNGGMLDRQINHTDSGLKVKL
jgi:hypothetical protein